MKELTLRSAEKPLETETVSVAYLKTLVKNLSREVPVGRLEYIVRRMAIIWVTTRTRYILPSTPLRAVILIREL